MFLNKYIASFFGIGYIGKGGGTIAALVTMLLWYLGFNPVFQDQAMYLLICCVICIIGIYSSYKVEFIWGHDSKRIVIDEVFGMLISLFFVPHQLWMGFTAFVLFRIFDIWKPFYIKKMEILKGGYGVMTDDLLAGIYTLICMQFLIKVIL
jgi:phosphatidylglycerophosphatase A